MPRTSATIAVGVHDDVLFFGLYKYNVGVVIGKEKGSTNVRPTSPSNTLDSL